MEQLDEFAHIVIATRKAINSLDDAQGYLGRVDDLSDTYTAVCEAMEEAEAHLRALRTAYDGVAKEFGYTY